MNPSTTGVTSQGGKRALRSGTVGTVSGPCGKQTNLAVRGVERRVVAEAACVSVVFLDWQC